MILTIDGYKALEASLAASQAEATSLKIQLSDALTIGGDLQAQVMNLTGALSISDMKLVALQVEHEELLTSSATVETNLETKVARKALEITQSQGIPAVGTVPSGKTAETNWSEQYRAEPDSTKRAAIYAAHREEILSGK